LVVRADGIPKFFAIVISRITSASRSIGSPPVKRIDDMPASATWCTTFSSSASDGCCLILELLSTLQCAHAMLQRRVTIIAIAAAP
jgi:hypothetical protein